MQKKYLYIFFLFLVLTLSFTSSVSSACELDKIDFGSSVTSAKHKYKFDDDILGGEYIEINLRSEDICKGYKGGYANLTFFKNRLVEFSINIKSDKPELYGVVTKEFGELSIKPNFSEIKNKPFASFVANKKFIVNYQYRKVGSEIHEMVHITKEGLTENLDEFRNKNEIRK